MAGSAGNGSRDKRPLRAWLRAYALVGVWLVLPAILPFVVLEATGRATGRGIAVFVAVAMVLFSVLAIKALSRRSD